MIKAWVIRNREGEPSNLSLSENNAQRHVNTNLTMAGSYTKESGVFMTADDLQKLWNRAFMEGMRYDNKTPYIILKDYLKTLGIELEDSK